jgi:hypothetical protein
MGLVDRIIGIRIAVVVVILYFTGSISGTLAIVLLVLSGISILTSIFSVCSHNMPFGHYFEMFAIAGLKDLEGFSHIILLYLCIWLKNML